jgi:3-oxoacyl-[acyl-carrier protein] reductase
MLLKNKIALVTGASRGIGRAIALELAHQGATVIGTATTEEGAKYIASHFEEHSLVGHGKVLDVTHPASIEQLLSGIKEQFESPTILINNAGITRDNLMLRMKDEEWDTVINTNLTSIYRLTKACLKEMLKAKWGRIINISSIAGVTGNPGQANYAAAKAGIIGFSKSLALEIASRDITVNVIAPGFIETDMTQRLTEDQKAAIMSKIPANRMGTPSEIAYTAAFLASPHAGYITGQTIHVNGGMYMN